MTQQPESQACYPGDDQAWVQLLDSSLCQKFNGIVWATADGFVDSTHPWRRLLPQISRHFERTPQSDWTLVRPFEDDDAWWLLPGKDQSREPKKLVAEVGRLGWQSVGWLIDTGDREQWRQRLRTIKGEHWLLLSPQPVYAGGDKTA